MTLLDHQHEKALERIADKLLAKKKGIPVTDKKHPIRTDFWPRIQAVMGEEWMPLERVAMQVGLTLQQVSTQVRRIHRAEFQKRGCHRNGFEWRKI